MLQLWPQGLQISIMTSIKGANKGCIKLADFGASKTMVKLATISEAEVHETHPLLDGS